MQSIKNCFEAKDFSSIFEPLKPKKGTNFFKVSHKFEELYGNIIRPSDKYFFIILLKLTNRYAEKSGWFWHTDKTFKSRGGKILGFESYGFSISASKRARKKLKKLGLIETKNGYNKSGHRGGTFYKINEEMRGNPKVHIEPPVLE